MIPTYRYSSLVPSTMPLDLNDGDQNHQASSSSSSPPHQHHDQTTNHSQTDHEEAEKNIIPSGRSWKKEGRNDQTDEGSVKWMSSKMRMMRKMMVSDQTVHEFEDHQKEQLSSSPANYNSCNSSRFCSNHNNNIMSVRVCADCHTTKTPLWRSGPTGPKSLCNACGIRQRKARRAAAAAAASANGTIVAPEASLKGNKIHKKKKPGIIGCAPQLKKKRKRGVKPGEGRTRNKYGLEDFAISLSKNLSLQQVFPQDEKEAAILLMALSYGLVHG